MLGLPVRLTAEKQETFSRRRMKMRFMMLVKADKDYEAGAPPNPELMAAIAKLAEEATARGEMVTAGGLLPSSQAVRIRVARGKTSVIDGPFAETKELVGGYAIFDLKSKEQAIEAGRRFMQIHADILGSSYEGELEIRPMFDEPPQHTKRS
jgi:hypothetical protein